MTVHSTLRRTECELEEMNRKKAELGVPPAIDFWPRKADSKEDLSNPDVLKQKKGTHSNQFGCSVNTWG